MIEALILAMIGGLLGARSYLLFNGYTVSTLAGGSFSQTAFAFAVTGEVIEQGLTLPFLWDSWRFISSLECSQKRYNRSFKIDLGKI